MLEHKMFYFHGRYGRYAACKPTRERIDIRSDLRVVDLSAKYR